jgi:hypothetical protein
MRFLLALLSVMTLRAVILDSIAVSVGTEAITESQIDQEIRLAAFTNGSQPDFSIEARRKAADQLIEQALIRREMSFGAYPPVLQAEIDAAFASTEKSRGGDAALDVLLKKYRLTAKGLRDYIAWQLQLLNFIDLRFRPAVQVTEEDVEKYYRENLAATHPGAVAVKAPPLTDVHDQIQQKLTGERVDQQLDQWISRSRSRAIIRYIDQSLGTTANVEAHVDTGQPH